MIWELMAVFWTAAEGLILVGVRWGARYVAGRKPLGLGFAVFFGLLVSAWIGLILFGEAALKPPLTRVRPDLAPFFESTVWNFSCAMWVVFEGVITIYAFRIYHGLNRLSGRPSDWGRRRWSERGWVVPAFACSILAVFAIYQAGYLSFALRRGIFPPEALGLSWFFIRIAGLFWVIINAAVALAAWRVYRVVRIMAEAR